MLISVGREGGGPCMWTTKFLIENIINFQNVDKPRGNNVDKVFFC